MRLRADLRDQIGSRIGSKLETGEEEQDTWAMLLHKGPNRANNAAPLITMTANPWR